jgi:hypothetical protein
MTVFLALLHIVIIFAISYRVWKAQARLRQFFWPALIIKFTAGVCLGLVYKYYYSVADTFDYFRDASRFADLALSDFSSYLELLFLNQHLDELQLVFNQPRAVFLTKITSVLNILTLNNYWIIGFYFSLISFLASWNLVKVISRHIPSVTTAAVLAFLFVPSVIFWTSGLLKESLAVAALYFLSAVFLKTWFQMKPSSLEYILAAVAVLVFWNLKYYYAAVFVPVIFTSLFYRFVLHPRVTSSAVVEVIIWLAILVLPLVLMTLLHPNFHPEKFLNVIAANNAGYYELSAPEDVVRFDNVQPTAWSLLKNVPWALFSGLFRPLFWEASAMIQVLPGIENTLLLLLFLTGTFHFKKYFTSPHRLLILALVAYVALLCVLITISAPNFGTLSRYRTGYLSFFVFIILCNHPATQYLERSFPRLVRD